MKKLYLCTCNKTLDKKLDFSKIEKETSSLFDKVEVVDALCLEEGLKELADNVDGEDTVVLGACSSQIIGVPISKHLKTDHVAYVPIREHIAWVHTEDNDAATNKAIVLLNDGATWLNHAIEKTDVSEEVVNHVLVIGGGLASYKAASSLLKLGIEVTHAKPLNWTKDEYLASLEFVVDEAEIGSIMKELEKSTKQAKSVNCDIEGFGGQIGNFNVTLRKEDETEEEINVGAIIIGVESSTKLPSNSKLYQTDKLEKSIVLSNLPTKLSEIKEENPLTILVTTDPKHNLTRVEGSRLLRITAHAAESGHSVFAIHQDIRTEDENLYRKAREAGVIFVRGKLKESKETDNGFTCTIENTLEELQREIEADLLVVQSITVPGKGLDALAETLGVDLDDSGFIKTRYSKMKPVQTTRKGIFLAGNAKMPMGMADVLTSGGNAALEAFKVVREPVKRRGWVPVIDEELCDVCKACLDSCPNDAIRLIDDKIQHIPVHCEFCGICVASCPTRAIEFQSHGKESWFARLETIAATHKKLMGDTPFTLVYACSECANASIDQAGFTGKAYPVNTYVLQFPCAGMISPIEILKGLVEGAENVIIAHCPPGGCHHQTGDYLSELVVQFTRDMLKEIGQDPERVRATFMIAALPDKMQKEVARRG